MVEVRAHAFTVTVKVLVPAVTDPKLSKVIEQVKVVLYPAILSSSSK